MPHRTEVCEIIPARAGRAVPPATPSRYRLALRPVDPSAYSSSLLRSDSWRYLALLHETRSDTSREPSGAIWCLFLSAIQCSTSRFACSLRPETVSKGLYGLPQTPQSGLLRCHCGDEPCPKSGTTRSSLVALQWRPQGPVTPDRPYIGVPYLGTTFGDSEDKGLQRCRPRPTPGPTCGLPNSQLPCASPPELCVGGAKQEKDRTLSGRGESFGTAAKTSTPGRKQPTNQTALEKCRRGGTPLPGRPPRQLKVRRGLSPLDPLATRPTPLREVPVPLPTVTPTGPQRATTPGMSFSTSRLISPRLVIR